MAYNYSAILPEATIAGRALGWTRAEVTLLGGDVEASEVWLGCGIVMDRLSLGAIGRGTRSYR
jgi:hypothetical protein